LHLRAHPRKVAECGKLFTNIVALLAHNSDIKSFINES
jgi:hypothetical protein